MSTPTKHAKLSPSSSHRWLHCTPSAVLESYEPSTFSTYAAEGTEAHALAELKLSYILEKISPEEYETRFEDFRLNSKYYSADMNEYINNYVNEIMTIVKEDNKGIDCKVYLEEFVKFEDIVPEGAGTSDVVIVGNNFIHIVDLKYGKGVPVSAIGNPQLRLYALGAVKQHLREVVVSEIRMTIIQPRLNDISTDFMTINELNDWAINFVKPRAQLAIEGRGELCSGDWCKFCKCKNKCKKLADDQLAIAQREFEDVVIENNILEPNNMSPEMLSRILIIAPKFIDWFKDIEKYTIREVINNNLKIPGFKLVRGRSSRTILNEDGIKEKLRTSGFSETDYLKPQELLGITALEKNIGKKLFNNLCEEFIVKPEGKLSLVPESDKRVAVDTNTLVLNGDEFEVIEIKD